MIFITMEKKNQKAKKPEINNNNNHYLENSIYFITTSTIENIYFPLEMSKSEGNLFTNFMRKKF
ncbi:hypothetical protein DERP_013565 [Dermatophagoides pteronyssinus]|uniref:Uncharacterized protein n=1 Tax=Dermatophagoides pteronyssinus TaxID=6956 RepID=A0ABQ8J5L9_DERPT|nr:hypothetical protein DERP_013565 [Dermatophagoides pteronyssinus]